MKKQNFAEAHKFADMLIRVNEDNEEGITLLISVMNFKNSLDFTINYLEETIEKQPLGFRLIELYIEVARRQGGKTEKIKEVIDKAHKKLHLTFSPGLIYCTGLFYRYTGEINVFG